MDKFLRHYQLLGIQPGTTWEQLRSAYRLQMRRWHPDKFGSDNTARQHAEELTKQINQAYQELGEYYKQHGHLPLQSTPAPVSRHPDVKASEPAPPVTRTAAAATQGTPPSAKVALFIGATAIIAALFVFDFTNEEQPSYSSNTQGTSQGTGRDSLALGNPETSNTDVQGKREEPPGFGLGSTLGDVYSIQGVPTKVIGNVWHYGEARVYFENGRVIRWIDVSPAILKIGTGNSASATTIPDASTFEVGSSKEEVQKAQGPPLFKTEQEWSYGASRVYFDRNNHVTGWSESPLDPLHTRK